MDRQQAQALQAIFDMGDDAQPKISHEGQIARLRDFAERLKVPCPFEVGQLVTPRQNANIRDAGNPHLVIEVVERKADIGGGVASSTDFAAPRDMRVACVTQDTDCLFLVWSGDFEPYPAA